MYIKTIPALRLTNYRLFTALLLSTALPWSFQTRADELTDIRSQISALQRRLDTLEKQNNDTPSPPNSQVKTSVDRKGFLVSDKNNYSLRIRPRIQIDGKWFPDDTGGKDEFLLRRVRPVFQGDAGPFSWRFMPELAGTVRILDAWVDLSIADTSYLRFGKMKQVVGYERLQSFSQTLFMEPSLASALTPVRDIGIEYHSRSSSGAFDITLGIYNGALEETDLSANTNPDGFDFDLGTRIALSPWVHEKDDLLEKLTIGLAVSKGSENSTINDSDRDRRIVFKTSGRNTFFRFNDGAQINGERLRINPFASWYYRNVGLLTEWTYARYDVNYLSFSEEIETQAYTIQGSWVVTGEAAGYNGIRPTHPWKDSGGFGAIELGLRIHALEVNDAAFANHSGSTLARSGSEQKATGYGAAINWYLTDNLRLSANYEITDFSGMGANRNSEKVLLTRMQIDF